LWLGGQECLHRTGDGHRGGELPRVALLFHFRDQHRADRGRVRQGRAGDGAEKGRGGDIDQRQAAADEADQHPGEGDQAAGHAAFGHDRAGQDEERNGQQGEFVHAAGDLDHHGVQWNIDPPGTDQSGQAEGVGYRNA